MVSIVTMLNSVTSLITPGTWLVNNNKKSPVLKYMVVYKHHK